MTLKQHSSTHQLRSTPSRDSNSFIVVVVVSTKSAVTDLNADLLCGRSIYVVMQLETKEVTNSELFATLSVSSSMRVAIADANHYDMYQPFSFPFFQKIYWWYWHRRLRTLRRSAQCQGWTRSSLDRWISPVRHIAIARLSCTRGRSNWTCPKAFRLN